MQQFQMTFGEQNTEKEAHDILNYAFEHGINALDTAEAVSSSNLDEHLLPTCLHNTQEHIFVQLDIMIMLG